MSDDPHPLPECGPDCPEAPPRRWETSNSVNLREIRADRTALAKDRGLRTAWLESIERLLPPHAHMSEMSTRYKWTTPLGSWSLGLDLRLYGGAPVSLTGPGGEWVLIDHRAEYVGAFLRLVGAI